MKTRVTSCALALVFLGALLMLPGSAVAQTTSNPFLHIPVTSTGGLFTGTLDITSFAVQNGQLVAVGTLTGTLIDTRPVVDFPVAIPVTAITATCDILHLELGPLDLDILGLVVHLDRIVLDINAEAAPGNLLGNLLCAITNLLNNPAAPLRGIAALLNAILGILG
jgi:hypothetical protein